VVREGERMKIASPFCRKLVELIHELEAGERKLGMENYAALRAG
jgi:hypothetical protein